MVLADEVDGGGDLDLIVSTMNGNVYCFQTAAAYHPLKAWPSQNQGMNVAFSRFGQEGIFFSSSSRQFRDVGSESFTVQYELVDARETTVREATGGTASLRGPYDVKVWLLMPGEKKLIEHKSLNLPGVYSVRIPCPSSRELGIVAVEMYDEHKRFFSDRFSLSFHMHFYRILKWVLVLPLLGMVFALVFRSTPENVGGSSLPSFTPPRHLP